MTSSPVVRHRTTNRVGCNAKIIFKWESEIGYIVRTFEESHNHRLCSGAGKKFLKVNRNLDIGNQEFIANCVKANIGPNKCFQLFSEFVGGTENVGATNVDFKNYRRNMSAYVKAEDAQMVIEKYSKKRDLCPNYVFEYDSDDNNQLTKLFWVDQEARKNYTAFGDVVSFDATYKTNRYCMVFVPFTGVDCHKKCVTFAAGLLTRKDVQSYEWLLKNFKRTMVREPVCIITDQDPSMKVAIANVFPTVHHRFCMWHIMTKVGEKVGPTLSKNEEFRCALNRVVWNETLTPTEFKERWHNVMVKYERMDHS